LTSWIAVTNAGSSSVKFAIYDATKEIRLFQGQIEGIGLAPHLTIRDDKGRVVEDRRFPSEGYDHDAATRDILAMGSTLLQRARVHGFGHRVVHGGLNYDRPARITPDVLDDLMKLAPLAPLHQPHNLAPIRTILNRAPEIPQVACFDTAFIAVNRIWPRHLLCRAGLLTRAFGATGFMACGGKPSISYRTASARQRVGTTTSREVVTTGQSNLIANESRRDQRRLSRRT
jgi:hypothetical protein